MRPRPSASRAPWLFAAAALSLSVVSPALAQYAGSAGDGYSAAGVSYVTMDGSVLSLPAYTASPLGGDGYARSSKTFLPLDGGTAPVAVFAAGSLGGDGYSEEGLRFRPLGGAGSPKDLFLSSSVGGDGYAFAGSRNLTLNGPAAVLASFKGGGGDGYDAKGFENRVIDPTAIDQTTYAGGAGDGYHRVGLINSSLGGLPAVDVLYTSGTIGGDGYDVGSAALAALNNAALHAEIYTSSSGGGDGYDHLAVPFAALSEGPYEAFYQGAGGDGYSTRGVAHVRLDGDALPSVLAFAGGSGDGYDTMALPFVQYMGGGEAAAGITFANWTYSRFSEAERFAGLADISADPDFDGLSNLMEFALGSDPRDVDSTVFAPQIRLSNLSELGLPALSDWHLTAVVRRNRLALDATLSVEVTDDVTSGWNIDDTVLVESVPSMFIVRDGQGVEDAPVRSMRVRATLGQ